MKINKILEISIFFDQSFSVGGERGTYGTLLDGEDNDVKRGFCSRCAVKIVENGGENQ